MEISEKLQKYIDSRKNNGRSDQNIIDELIKTGWSDNDASELLNQFNELELANNNRGNYKGVKKISFFQFLLIGMYPVFLLIASLIYDNFKRTPIKKIEGFFPYLKFILPDILLVAFIIILSFLTVILIKSFIKGGFYKKYKIN